MVHCHISDKLKEMALSMSLQGLSGAEVREYTGISEWSLKRLQNTHQATGAVSCPSPGQFWVLTSMEAKVCHTHFSS